MSERRELLERAVDKWRHQLVDLTGRNRLLAFKDLKRSTLDLSDADAASVRELLDGTPQAVSKLWPAEDQRERLGHAVRSCVTMARTARSALEERGVETLHLGWQMINFTWEGTAATPAAPLLIATVELTSKGAAGADFTIGLTGDWDVNGAFRLLMAREFEIDIPDRAALAEGAGIGVDAVTRHALAAAVWAAIDGVPDVKREEGRVVLANFSYSKLAVVQDLETNLNTLLGSDLVCAIAGDSDARDALRGSQPADPDPNRPDTTAPADEFLVLDADSSQNVAINMVLDGGSCVIQGPPGTGKSQTIANLIAAASARGERVLFVAEKRAAIEAVVSRLEHVGLGALVLDLHAKRLSKKDVAAALKRSLDQAAAAPQVSRTAADAELVEDRATLVSHAAALHKVREPWGVSLAEVQFRALSLRAKFELTKRFRGAAIRELGASEAITLRRMIEEWVALTEPMRSGRSSWVGATVTSEQDASETSVLLDELVNGQLDLAIEAIALVVGASDEMPFSRGVDIARAHQAANLARGLRSEVYTFGAEQLALALAPAGQGIWARLRADGYRPALKQAREYWVGGQKSKPTAKQLLGATEAAAEAQKAWRHAALPGTPDGAAEDSNISALVETVEASLTQIQRLSGIELQGSLGAIRLRVGALVSDQAQLHRLPRIHKLAEGIKQYDARWAIAAVEAGEIAASEAAEVFELVWLESIADEIRAKEPIIRDVDGRSLTLAAERFVIRDEDHLATTPQRIIRATAEQLIAARTAHPTQDDLIRREAGKSTRHLPVRSLVERAPDVLFAVHPCWAMSPLLVSEVLPPGELFDIVVFDEASQVLPWDAVASIARGKRVVVAGDRHQLPPTTFFAGGTDESEGEGENENEAEEALSYTEGFPSILEVMEAMLPQRMLTWHYRSEDDRLIAFCNRHVYGDALTTFPGASSEHPLAFELHPVPSGHSDTVSNSAEAEAVTNLLIDHARSGSEDSIGVIALGSAHANRIRAALDDRLSAENDPHLWEFFDADRPERVFVKNIETVQGDERDRIIISVGYNKGSKSRMTNNLGPINQAVGYRRLNVAFTRARRHMTAVVGFTTDEMSAENFKSRGATMLRDWIHYVETGGEVLGGRAHVQLNAFELDVKSAIEEAGYECEPQWGVGRYRLDFAIRDPKDKSRFILAVEADGASHHSSLTARDRDRLRQRILEARGWSFHRIWSTDWFYDRASEVARLGESLKAAADGGWILVPGEEFDDSKHAQPAHRQGSQPIRGGRPSIDEYTDSELRKLLIWIRSDTLLRTDDELVNEARELLGFQKTGPKIRRRLQQAVDRTVPTGSA